VLLLVFLLFIALQTNTPLVVYKHGKTGLRTMPLVRGGENYQANSRKLPLQLVDFMGKGPGNSTQRNFLPHPYSDFIYAIIVEEYGLTWWCDSRAALPNGAAFRAGIIVKKPNAPSLLFWQ
jgi:cell division protein FtsW